MQHARPGRKTLRRTVNLCGVLLVRQVWRVERKRNQLGCGATLVTWR